MSKKMPASVCWPYKTPTKEEDKTGKRHGMIQFQQALYYITKTREWIYLGLCECGKEHVLTGFLSIAPTSCGCAILNAKRGGKTSIPDPLACETVPIPVFEKKRKWPRDHDRTVECISPHKFRCEHYTICQNEKVLQKKKMPTRFKEHKGLCYEATAEELRLTTY